MYVYIHMTWTTKNLSMEIISSSVSGCTRQTKISSNSDDDNIFTFPSTMNNNNNDDHEGGDQHSQDNHTTFEFKFDPHQSANSSCDSPGSPFKDSPADHLFRNGILLPHSFPVQPMFNYYGSERRSYQRSASRTSSVGSKDSLISSRSNSINSRSSSCSSSARTSISDTASDRKLFLYNNVMNMRGSYHHQKRPQPLVLDQVYGSSRRWQFISPMPVLTQETISSRPTKQKHVTTTTKKIKTKKKTSATGSASWSILRFFRYVLSVCRECHALEPSVRSVSSIHEIPSH